MTAASIRAAIPHAKPITVVSGDGVTVYDLPVLLEALARCLDAEAAVGVFRDRPFDLFNRVGQNCVPTVSLILRELCRLAETIPVDDGLAARRGLSGTAGLVQDETSLSVAFVGQFSTRMDYMEAVKACGKVFPQHGADASLRVP